MRNLPALVGCAVCLGATSAFTAPHAVTGFSILDSVRSLFDQKPSPQSVQDIERDELKESLLELCRIEGLGMREKRKRVEEIIEELAGLSPTKSSATSPLLQKEWKLEWTTEKEINVFSDWGISGLITQTIDGDKLGNMIEFRKGGGLGVSGALSVSDEKSVRSNFKFTSATLDLGRWGTYNVPPVGEGWFDTIYLDDELRVDTNSRDDILICTPL